MARKAASSAPPLPSTPAKRARATDDTAHSSTSPSKRRTTAAEPSTQVNPSAASLLQQSQLTTDEWYRSKSTKNGYANYVKAGKKWLAEWITEDRTDGRAQTGDGRQDGDERSFAGALDMIKEETPVALRLLIAYKCDHQGKGFSTAEGIRAAFKDYFERVLNCQGDYWKHNPHTNKWEGNPVFQTDFKVYFESLKNRQNRTATSTQALPMLPKDMKVIMSYLDSPEGAAEIPELQRIYWKAFATTAINLWTRNEELVNFKYGDLKPHQQSISGELYHEFRLVFRKTNKDPSKVQIYQIPSQPDMPEIDCYANLSAWLAVLQTQLHRPLEASDYLFPAFASTGKLKFGEPMSRAGLENLMDQITDKSGVMTGRNGKFTTHCFRRGGAQYRFMWAERKWSLKAVKWWGGWSSSENVGTIMRYLLDELMAYEEGFTDILMNNRASDRHESFMGAPDPSAQVTRNDLNMLAASLRSHMESLLLATPSSSHSPAMQSTQEPSQSNAIVPLPSIMPALLEAQQSLAPARIVGSAAHPVALRLSPSLDTESDNDFQANLLPPTPVTDRPSRIPVTHTMDDVIKYWTEGDPSKGLVTPLRDWPFLFNKKAYKSEAQKFSNIRIVYEEYEIHCGRDKYTFCDKYPGLWHRFTRLVEAVREVRKLRGDTKPRHRKK